MIDKDFEMTRWNQLKSRESVWSYICGGRGVFALESPTGKRHIYAIRRPWSDNRFPEGTFFVHDTDASRTDTYIGMIQDGQFHMTSRSRYARDSEEFRGMQYIMNWINHQDMVSPMKIYHNGTCCICGGHLSTEESMARGMGPRCYEKFTNQQVNSASSDESS